ncbi:MAG TPA: hypothetical protein VGN00_10090 [Puia sp.]
MGGTQREFAKISAEVAISDNKLTVYTTMYMGLSHVAWIDTSISNSNTLAPIYRSSSNPYRDFVLHYGQKVTGYYLDKKTGKRTALNDPAKGEFIDEHVLASYLTTLPLTSGYKKALNVYVCSPAGGSNIKSFSIDEVRTNLYTSPLTGDHPVWQVTVTQQGSSNILVYYIDKSLPRVWKMDMNVGGQNMVVVDDEIDYSPFKTKFDKDEALKMIKDGSATIDGQAFARDNQAAIKGIAVLNLNKKQCAPVGTSVVLVPYTDFFKEWFELNKSASKKGKSVPLPKEAAQCIKTTTVYDKDGHFEFTNLMPGDYMLLTQFSYVHTGSASQVTGYTDTYIDGAYVGSNPNISSYNYNQGAVAGAKKVVTVSQPGEKLTIKLKQTL